MSDRSEPGPRRADPSPGRSDSRHAPSKPSSGPSERHAGVFLPLPAATDAARATFARTVTPASPMPAFSTIAVPALLPAATRLFTGLRDNPEIAAALDAFGYDAAAATAGLDLIAALRDAMKAQGTESAEASVATHASIAASAAVRAAYVPHRILARRRQRRGTAGYAALRLAGDVPEGEAEMLAHARHFYETLAGSPELADGIRSINRETLTAALARLDAADLADGSQTKEDGESQRATAIRAGLEARLRAECSELAEAAGIALADKPQLREVLGLLER